MDNSDFNTNAFLESLGGCGRFQVILTCLFSLSSIPAMFTFMIMTFGMHNPGWRCLDNMTYALTNGSLYTDSNGTTWTRFEEINQTLPEYVKGTCEGFDTCQQVEFNPEAVTIVTEWGLACNRGWILSTVLSIQMAGNLCSTILTGYVGDKCGRKMPYFVSRIFMTGFNLISMFSVSWQMYAVTLFLLGFNGSFGVLAMVNLTEYVTPKWRVRINSIPTWSIIAIMFSVTAMLTKSWKSLRLIAVVTGVVSIFAVILIPESIRWLSVRGKGEKVLKVSKRVAKLNKAPEPQRDQIDVLIEKSQEGQKKAKTYTIFHLFRKGYRLPTVIAGVVFFSTDVTWYAFSFGIAALPGNIYINLILFTVTDLPPSIISFSIANMFRRKPAMFTCFLLESLCLFGVVAVDFLTTGDVKAIWILALVLVAKLFLYVSWIVLFTAVLELYPTVVRSTVVSYVMLMSSIGGVFAPYLIPTEPNMIYICYSLMAVLSLLCAGLILLIPETKGKPLQDNWEDHHGDKDGKKNELENKIV